MILKIKPDIDVSITPEELAALFESADNIEQVRFFNELAILVKSWNFPAQLDLISYDENLTDEARQVMLEIGQYSYKTRE